MIIEPSTSNAPEIEDGLYIVEVLGIDPKVVENDQYGKSKKLEFHLQVFGMFGGPLTDEDDEPVVIDPLMNQAWSERSTLFKYAQAFGLDPDPMRPIDTDRFKGKRAQALIHTESEGAWPRVKELLPLAKGKASNGNSKAPAAPQKPVEASSQQPAMITPDYTIDWTVFWAACKAAGIPNTEVAAEVEGGLTTLKDMDPTDVVELFNIIKGRHEGEASVPFDR